MSMHDWDAYLEGQRTQLANTAAQVQSLVNAYGLPLERLQELAKIDLNNVDPALLQQISMKTGIRLEELKTERPTPNGSYFAQRTRAVRV